MKGKNESASFALKNALSKIGENDEQAALWFAIVIYVRIE